MLQAEGEQLANGQDLVHGMHTGNSHVAGLLKVRLLLLFWQASGSSAPAGSTDVEGHHLCLNTMKQMSSHRF
jgi:hypothetical protein